MTGTSDLVAGETQAHDAHTQELSPARVLHIKAPGGIQSFALSESAVENGTVWWSAGVSANITNYGCSCTMSTLRPKVNPGDFSTMLALVSNDDSSHPEQTVQAGWIRATDPAFWPSSVDPDLCQVFVYFSAAGSTGTSSDNVEGWNDEVIGWVQADGAFRPGHDLIPASHINGSQGFLDLKFQLNDDRWDLQMNGTVIGHYPTSLFTVNTQDPTRPPLPDQSNTLADHATKVAFFGQVCDATSDGMTSTEMGSGKYPDDGFGRSAFISRMQYQPSPTSQKATMEDADSSWNQFSDDPMRYESRVSWKSNSSWRTFMYLGGPGCEATGWSSWESAGGIFTSGTPIASVSRKPSVIDLFIVGNDGKVYTSWWIDQDWSGFNSDWRLLDWGGGEKFLVGSKIAAVARSPDNLDIFIIGQDFKIYTAWWSEGNDWTGFRNISGNTSFPAPYITAISRMEGQLDVMVASAGFMFYSHWTDSVTDWTGIDQPWDDVGPVSIFSSFLNVVVVSRTQDTMEIFTVGIGSNFTATVLWNTWSAGPGATYGTWQAFSTIGSPPSLLLGSRVAAVARGSDRVDVFVIGTDSCVYSSFWSPTIWSGIEDEWKQVGLAISGVSFTYSDIIAVSRSPAIIDVLVSSFDGNIYAASLDGSVLPDPVWTNWQSLGGKAFLDPVKFEFTAVSRNHQTLTAIGCGLNNKVWAADWLDPVCGPRPFYCMAHNPNVYFDGGTDDPTTALLTGANALGPDVNRSKDSGKLVIAHGGFLFVSGPGSDSDPDLITYLKHLRVLAENNPAFALVAFDCKEGTYLWSGQDIGASFGLELLTAIRDNLTNFVPLDIIISVPDRKGVSVFQNIHNMLTPREAIAIDQEDDPDFVARHFQQLGATSNAVYGYGNTFQLPAFVPHLRLSIEWGVAWRTGYGLLQAVYEWTSDDLDRIREHIRIGADGVMSNFEFLIPASLPDPPALKSLVDLVKTDREMRRLVRMATRNDRILAPSKPGYLLWVYTGSTGAAGTDAKITFVVRGELGIIKKTVDTSLQGRMESGKTDFVVIQSRDIGNLSEVTIYNNMGASFLGNSAWRCEKISVVSFRYGVDVTAVFGVNIDANPVTRGFS